MARVPAVAGRIVNAEPLGFTIRQIPFLHISSRPQAPSMIVAARMKARLPSLSERTYRAMRVLSKDENSRM
jgi:hypothetical protein